MYDFPTPNFAYAPLQGAERLDYDGDKSWSATFNPSVSDLLLYVAFWRVDGSESVTYTFDQSFAIVSGLSEATVTGNTLTLLSSGFHSGVLKFSGPLSSLAVSTTVPSDSYGGGQALTFGLSQQVSPAAAIAALSSNVEALVTVGTLSSGQGNALISKLDAADAKLAQGKPQTAINQLQAFINQTQALINGKKLTTGQGQPLLDAANAIINQLSQ